MLTGDNRRTADGGRARSWASTRSQAEVLPAGQGSRWCRRLAGRRAHRGHGRRRHQRRPRAGRRPTSASPWAPGPTWPWRAPGVTLVKGDLRGIARARTLSRGTMRNIRQNLFFAFIYNALGVPIAAGVLYPFFGIAAQPDDRQRGDELQLGLGDQQRAAAAKIEAVALCQVRPYRRVPARADSAPHPTSAGTPRAPTDRVRCPDHAGVAGQ